MSHKNSAIRVGFPENSSRGLDQNQGKAALQSRTSIVSLTGEPPDIKSEELPFWQQWGQQFVEIFSLPIRRRIEVGEVQDAYKDMLLSRIPSIPNAGII